MAKEKVSLRLDNDLLKYVDDLNTTNGAVNRSENFRRLIIEHQRMSNKEQILNALLKIPIKDMRNEEENLDIEEILEKPVIDWVEEYKDIAPANVKDAIAGIDEEL